MKPKLPTPAEIETRKRLRLICNWFDGLNTRAPIVEDSGTKFLDKKMRQEIDAQNFDPADLMEIRNAPGRWTLRDPYTWLWILHRYQHSPK